MDDSRATAKQPGEKLRILLTTAEDIHAFERGSAKAYPKLGLLALIAYVRENLEGSERIEFRQQDMLLEGLEAEDVAARVERFQPDVVGISCLSYSETAFHAVAEAVKQARPETLVIGGGPYVSSSREAVLRDPHVDLLLFDESELSFCQLMGCLLDGGDYRRVPGLAHRAEPKEGAEVGEVITNPPQPMIEDLDCLPIPAFDAVDFDAYSRFNPHLDDGGRFAPIVTSRGCPFRCVYCHALHGKQTRFRSADHVMREIEHLYYEHGVRLIYVYDDIFNLQVDRAKEICRRIIDSGMDLGIDFLNGLRGDLMDHELIDLMIEAGTYYFAYAIETATPRLQDLIRKYNRLDELADTIEYTVRRGEGRCVVATYNMIGFPTETEDEVWNTVEFNRSLPHHIADVAVAIPQENTEMFQMARDVGFEVPAEKSPNYGKDVLMSASEKISPQRLNELLIDFKRTFFDDDRTARLARLTEASDNRSQTRFLASFVRGYINISQDFVGDTNSALRSGVLHLQ